MHSHVIRYLAHVNSAALQYMKSPGDAAVFLVHVDLLSKMEFHDTCAIMRQELARDREIALPFCRESHVLLSETPMYSTSKMLFVRLSGTNI